MKLYYEDILVAEVLVNHSITIEEVLNLIDFDKNKFIEEQGFEDIDHNDFKLIG
ncbi:hypothetical protein GCM10011391_27880 [Pullulanibacillus camelliae]|uniref:Uncharacterized protein n=1 Tax=Pullulanibacillus camelliae TaxID=1707096 RepID=A0A8J2YJS8_9BACL|nr:hypothetical protein [Pullulanibacillus camelliae]GGE47491.1 hypothetical protein GCM10011391_27880 [Pullulanibacillus camelliae]